MKQKLIKKLIIGFVAMSSCALAGGFSKSNSIFAMQSGNNNPEPINFVSNNDMDKLTSEHTNRYHNYHPVPYAVNLSGLGDEFGFHGFDVKTSDTQNLVVDYAGGPGLLYENFVKAESVDELYYNFYGRFSNYVERLEDWLLNPQLRYNQYPVYMKALEATNRAIVQIFEHILGSFQGELTNGIKNRAKVIEARKLNDKGVSLVEINACQTALDRLYRLYLDVKNRIVYGF